MVDFRSKVSPVMGISGGSIETSLFMHKLVYKSSPPSILNLITIDHLGRTDSNHYTFNTPILRLKPYKNSIFAKGPQFYNHFIPLISNSLEPRDDPTHSAQPNPFKNCIKNYLMRQQAQGEADEWNIDNLSMYTGIQPKIGAYRRAEYLNLSFVEHLVPLSV